MSGVFVVYVTPLGSECGELASKMVTVEPDHKSAINRDLER